MTSPAPRTKQNGRWGPAILAVLMVAVVAFTPPGHALGGRFFASLRIAKPQPVNVNIPSFTGPNANRQLLDMIGGMVADTAHVTLDEPEQPAGSVLAAAKLAGFTPRLPRARADGPTLTVWGAHAVTMRVDRGRLRTILMEAGKPSVALAPSLNGSTLSLGAPRAVRAQYGNCPPPANTIQAQINGPPPPSSDNANCLVLTESPAASSSVPPGLDTNQLEEIALELSGMSPNQTRDFQKVVDWTSALVLSLPRGVRAYDLVDVAGAKGMLVNTAARRGPTYVLIWANGGVVYSLAGFGNPADAVPLARSLE